MRKIMMAVLEILGACLAWAVGIGMMILMMLIWG
jgi:hypothetical protein